MQPLRVEGHNVINICCGNKGKEKCRKEEKKEEEKEEKVWKWMKRKKKMSVLNMVMDRWRPQLDAILSTFVSIYPHETSPLLHSSSCFFFVMIIIKSCSSFVLFFKLISRIHKLTLVFLVADFECIFCSVTIAGWRCNLSRFIEASSSLYRILIPHLDCCSFINSPFLFP